MSLPSLNAICRPLLEAISDGEQYDIEDVAAGLVDRMGIPPEEAERRTRRGRQTLFTNRVWWVKSYLARAGLVELTGPRMMRITDEGRGAVLELELGAASGSGRRWAAR